MPMATSILRRCPPEREEIFFPACLSRPTVTINSSTSYGRFRPGVLYGA